jgi:hypothetical protein
MVKLEFNYFSEFQQTCHQSMPSAFQPMTSSSSQFPPRGRGIIASRPGSAASIQLIFVRICSVAGELVGDDMADKSDFPPVAEEAPSGTIRPPLLRAWLGTLFGLMMLLAALWAAIGSHNSDVAAAAAFLGIVFVGASAPQIAWDHKVRWNQTGIEGPAKMFGLTLGPTRTEIAWSDIVRTGRTQTGYWYVESRDGRRVYWSYLCVGYEALTRELQRKCPPLFGPRR